ncbi:unnamed protein product [Mytilus edulis]|uniref:Uncharacterized protein n=1 Tax=Mytilus edulis TaxID=6550 RepID=A0A8S3RR34_MYTED|nr:unnamed protein product [Mytilus edulis]
MWYRETTKRFWKTGYLFFTSNFYVLWLEQKVLDTLQKTCVSAEWPIPKTNFAVPSQKILSDFIAMDLDITNSALDEITGKDSEKESDWYNSLTDEVKTKVSFKLYELVPRTCAIKYDIPNEDNNIRDITTFHIGSRMRSGNHRDLCIKMYSINIDQEVSAGKSQLNRFFTVCEYPDVVSTLKAMADNYLAKFSSPQRINRRKRIATAGINLAGKRQAVTVGQILLYQGIVLNHFLNALIQQEFCSLMMKKGRFSRGFNRG